MYTVAIGDIHGCYKQLEELMDCIRRYVYVDKDTRYIFLGDYVDRGRYSKTVLDYLMNLQRSKDNIVCLMGNHEDNLVKCYYGGDLGEKNYEYNNSMGGNATLKSFGVNKIRDIPVSYIEWMKALPYYAVEKNDDWGDNMRVYVHAGINRSLPMEQQSQLTMLWDREMIKESPLTYMADPFKRLVVHGHTPVGNPEYTGGRVNLDTGCVFGFDEERGYGDSNRSLTAGVFSQERPGPVKVINHRGIYLDV